MSSTIAWTIGASLVMVLNVLFGKGGTLIDPLIPLAVMGAVVVWSKLSQPKTAIKVIAHQ